MSMNEHLGHGQRLTIAFEALEQFPALAESRNRLLSALGESNAATAEIVSAIESDVALVLAVLRLANTQRTGGQSIDTTVAAVESLRPQTLQALAGSARTFDFFDRASIWGSTPERFRRHALATQRAADRIAFEVGHENRDRLALTSLLHDIGELVLIHAYPDSCSQAPQHARTPEERVRNERTELGVDHALVGGVLVRRWGLPGSLAGPIERHHNPDATGEAAIIRLADMLAHYEQGTPVAPGEMVQSARAVGLGPQDLRGLLYEQPGASNGRRRHVDPCPLSGRELEIVKQLAKGSVYKEIARDLELSVSTVRTHLYNSYRKLNVADRAQAVLIATERGWLCS
jgi:HD-like signal output (HDOD) protein/DNA-binding CsgD family transcriptional regulator